MDYDHLKYVSAIDPAELDQLMSSYGQDVWNYAYFMARSAHMADDIAQDVFLKAYRNISSFRGTCTIKSWLLKITHNTALNYRRSAFVRKVTLLDFVQTFGKQRSAESEAIDRLVSDEIWRLVIALPVKYREVLLLHIQHNLSLEEMSSITGVPVGTVKSRLYRARTQIAKQLKEAALYE